MSDFMSREKVKTLLTAALECSFYVSPESPGLTHEELHEAGKELGLQQGEINDVIHEVVDIFVGMGRDTRRLPTRSAHLANWQYFISQDEPEYRNIFAFDAVYSEWRNAARRDGRDQVRLERNVLVERAFQNGIPRHDTHVAISILIFSEMLVEENGILRPKMSVGEIVLPSEQVRKNVSDASSPQFWKRLWYQGFCSGSCVALFHIEFPDFWNHQRDIVIGVF